MKNRRREVGEKCDERKGAHLRLHPSNMRPPHIGAGLPSACHSGDDWGGGVGGRGEEGSQCWQGRDCLGCEAPSPSSPASSDPRTDDCSAAGSSSSIAGWCRCLYSPQTSQPYPWGRGHTLLSESIYFFFDVVVVCQKWIRFILAQELNNESGWNTGHDFKTSRKQHFYIITSKMLFLYFYLCLMCASLNPALFPYIIYSPLLAEKKQMLPHIPRVDDTIWVFVYYISVR